MGVRDQSHSYRSQSVGVVPGWSIRPGGFCRQQHTQLAQTFSLYPINGKYRVQTLQVEAISIGEGPALKFVSGTITIADNTSQIDVDMPSTVTVGNTISNSTLTLYWEENVNGKGFKPDTVTPATIEQLFVTAAQPVNAKLDPPTVARVNYATKLAQGTASSNIMAIANKIDADAMSEEHFTYETSAYRQAVWTGASMAGSKAIAKRRRGRWHMRRRIVADGRRPGCPGNLVGRLLRLSSCPNRLLEAERSSYP